MTRLLDDTGWLDVRPRDEPRHPHMKGTTMRAAVMHGPNLNRLGKRRPEKYGYATLDDITEDCRSNGERLGLTIETIQSNHEGTLIDWLHERQESLDLIVLNPAGLTGYAYSLLDTICDTGLPFGIVHISQFHAIDGLTRQDIFAPHATVYITGLGWRGYSTALEALKRKINEQQA